MNPFASTFNRVKQEHRAAFMPFVVAGDPNFNQSLQFAQRLAQAADFLEIGFPYSDPLADGPTIQAAGTRAIGSGMTTDKVFSFIKQLNSATATPITVLVYANLVLQQGVENFYRKAKASGVSGVLVPDLPVEEAGEFVKAAKKFGIAPIFLVSQTTEVIRLKRILKVARGYLYLVSVLGVTGSRRRFHQDTLAFIKRIKAASLLPVAVGFGISSPKQAKAFYQAGADGVIVGSALIDEYVRAGELRALGLAKKFVPARKFLQVKICGVRTPEAARTAAQSGADFLGLNFAPASKRRVSLAQAKLLIQSLPKKRCPKLVGVFQNQPLAFVKSIAKTLNLDLVQLHGQESPAYCSKIKRPVIKAFGLRPNFNLKNTAQKMSKYQAEYFLLDRLKQGQGQILDLKKVTALAKIFPVILSGGLTVQNIGPVIRQSGNIKGVDIAGGAESRGRQDVNKIRQFARQAKQRL